MAPQTAFTLGPIDPDLLLADAAREAATPTRRALAEASIGTGHCQALYAVLELVELMQPQLGRKRGLEVGVVLGDDLDGYQRRLAGTVSDLSDIAKVAALEWLAPLLIERTRVAGTCGFQPDNYGRS